MIHFPLKTIVVLIFLILTSIFIEYRLKRHDFYDISSCPFCYGTDFCHREEFSLRWDSLQMIFNNYLSVKNVFFTTDGKVLKKLAHNWELSELDEKICALFGLPSKCNVSLLDINSSQLFLQDLDRILNEQSAYKFCSEKNDEILGKMLEVYNNSRGIVNLWTLLQVNIEPIILKIFEEENFNFPKYYGACGRLIVVENSGVDINECSDLEWTKRAKIALNLLEISVRLTKGNENYRIYLTDISPENFAVDLTTLKVTVVDLENLIIFPKKFDKTPPINFHKSSNFDDEFGTFSYSVDEICSSSISDHNIYAICKLLLSKNAPWPMMSGGLLHSAPEDVTKLENLEKLVESCVEPLENENRFEIAESIIMTLKEILREN